MLKSVGLVQPPVNDRGKGTLSKTKKIVDDKGQTVVAQRDRNCDASVNIDAKNVTTDNVEQTTKKKIQCTRRNKGFSFDFSKLSIFSSKENLCADNRKRRGNADNAAIKTENNNQNLDTSSIESDTNNQLRNTTKTESTNNNYRHSCNVSSLNYDYYSNSNSYDEKSIAPSKSSNLPTNQRNSSESSGSPVINSDDENKIRIKVSYNDEDHRQQQLKQTETLNRKTNKRHLVNPNPRRISNAERQTYVDSDPKGVTTISTTPPSITKFKQKESVTHFSAETYNEKPIDVPENFERDALERILRHNNSRLKRKLRPPVRHFSPRLDDFLKEDWIKIDEEFDDTDYVGHPLYDYDNDSNKSEFHRNKLERNSFGSIRRHSDNDIKMGTQCSKQLSKVGKHSVVPESTAPVDRRKKLKKGIKSFFRNSTNTIDQLTPTAKPKSTNPFDEDDEDEDVEFNIEEETKIEEEPEEEEDEELDVKNPFAPSYRKHSAGAIFSPQFYTPRPSSGSIDANSIMYRSREIYSARKRSIVREHFERDSFHRKNSCEIGITDGSVKKENYSNLYHRLGGSIQNLVGLNKNVRKISVSETNLSQCTQNKRLSSSSININNNVDYCPSVLYNRLSISRDNKEQRKELNTNLGNKLKKLLNINYFLKKPKVVSSRKSIQDLDGGFFEKFGSLLRQKSEIAEEKIAPLAPMPDNECAANAEDGGEECSAAEPSRLRTIEEGENDSGTDTLADTDSETDEQGDANKQHDFFGDLVGWNIEELYEEILFEILHNVGCEIDDETAPSALFSYLQDAFKIVNERHEEIFKSAESKEAPEIRLNVEIIEAKELQPKDPNGLSDPFVTMYIASSPTHRYNTSVKSETLNPMWEEHFSLPINENGSDENLVVEVWDFDPAETVGEKMTKFFDVKGVKGFKKLMKEIAVTASTGKHDNELIGRCNIALRTIPASGLVMWFSLDKKQKLKRQGLIKIRLTFSAEKNNKVAAQEHRHLLRILLMHELDTSKVAPYWWSGKFSAQGEAVITQHSAQSALSPTDCALAQWSVYSAIHGDHPLSFGLFDTLLDKIVRPIQTNSITDDEVKIFWDGVKKLLPSCFSIIRKLRKKTTGDKLTVKVLNDVLSILSKIALLEPPEGTDLFPKNVYGWITRTDDEPSWDLHGTLQDAVTSGAKDWLNHINGTNDSANASDEDRLQNIIKIIQLVRSDLQRSIEYYDKLFQQRMHFPYARTCYVYYEEKLAEFIEPIIDDVCKNLKRLSLPEDRYQALPEHEEVNMGTTLFELYLVLKRFTVLGTALSPVETEFKISKYHLWFTPGVTHWLDISVYKALIRIEKAIELDLLEPVTKDVKYSSSAVDTLAIFYQIKIFWQQLDWPDVEGCYMFVGKIVDDICRCCIFYADRMSTKVEGMGNVQNVYEGNKFEVTRGWCLAINNIDYIRQSLAPFLKELKVDDIISKLADFRSPMEAERCSDTMKNVISNAIDTETNKILELIDVVARKMSPPMRRFLTEGAELLHQDSNSMDRLLMYLEDSLKTLNAELNEINFDRVLDAIWTELSSILFELVQNNIDKRRPPSFFANLRDTLQLMVRSFKCTQSNPDKVSSDKETLEAIERLLELHAYETSDLIHQYYLEQLIEQQAMTDSPYGLLTVKCVFKDDHTLEVNIMNARNLLPMDSNGSCDSFVRIHFIPEDKFANTTKPKTNAHNKTLFPLYDEKFTIQLTPDQKVMDNAMILFSVKDKDLFGMSNQYIAECYLAFKDIPNIEDDGNNEQIHLKLNRPSNLNTDCIRALDNRQGDKQAKDFMKKLKQKMVTS